MTLTQLEYFCAVCRYHSITRAAEVLFVSQSTISVAIRGLEKEFQIALFSHQKNRIVLTAAGERFYARAEKLIHESESIYSDFSGKAGEKPPLRIAYPPLIGTVFFPQLGDAFQEETGSALQLFEVNSLQACRLLESNEIDAAFVNLDNYEIDRFEQMLLLEDATVYAVAADHPLALAGRTSCRLEELANEPVILYGRDSVHYATMMARYKRSGIKPHAVLHTTQLATILAYLSNGRRGAFLYSSLIPLQDKRWRKILLEPKLTTRFGLIWRKQEKNKQIADFVEFAATYQGIIR